MPTYKAITRTLFRSNTLPFIYKVVINLPKDLSNFASTLKMDSDIYI